MNKQQALQFLAQVAQDFLNTLPVSAREPFRQAAQQAITTLDQPSHTDAAKPPEVPTP